MSKLEATQIDVASSIDDSTAVKDFSDEDNDVGFSQPETGRLLRKLDRTLLPFLSLLYLLSFLDRANIGNAKLAGLEKSLGMTGYDYSVSIVPSVHLPSSPLHDCALTSPMHRPPWPSSFPFTSPPRFPPTWP